MLEYALTTLLIVQSIQEQSLSSSKEICGEEKWKCFMNCVSSKLWLIFIGYIF